MPACAEYCILRIPSPGSLCSVGEAAMSQVTGGNGVGTDDGRSILEESVHRCRQQQGEELVELVAGGSWDHPHYLHHMPINNVGNTQWMLQSDISVLISDFSLMTLNLSTVPDLPRSGTLQLFSTFRTS